MSSAPATEQSAGPERIDTRALRTPAVLIFNPNAGKKLGMATNAAGMDAIQPALEAAGIDFEERPTEYAGHATELAREAMAEGRQLVIAAGGDGTVREVAAGLINSETALGIMPLGSVMNLARTLCIPRDMKGAAESLATGRIVRMDAGLIGENVFLEAGGVGLDAGLLAYFERLDKGSSFRGVARGAIRFLRGLGSPQLSVRTDTTSIRVRAPMVAVANTPFVGAAYNVAPDARIDDGLLDVVVFRNASILRTLVHLAFVAGGRRAQVPQGVVTMRARFVEINPTRKRPLPVHADGTAVGIAPARFEAIPGALRVIVGEPVQGQTCAWT